MSGYVSELDAERLTKKYRGLFQYMVNQQAFKTLREISTDLNYPEATVSAMLRYFRRFGHVLNKVRRGNPTQGLWEYKLESAELYNA